MLYVFGYGKNWWKSDEKLLIFIMCLKIEKKKKKREKEKRYKVTLWKEKTWKVEKKMQTKEVHELSSSQDYNEGRWAKKIYVPSYMLY